jgi:hypothetical protein
MLSKIKIIYYFLKIKLNKIFNLLLKTATAYIVASIACRVTRCTVLVFMPNSFPYKRSRFFASINITRA